MSGRSSLMTDAPSLIGRPPKRRFTVASTPSSGPRLARFPWASAGRGPGATMAASPDAPSHPSARSAARRVIDMVIVLSSCVRGIVPPRVTHARNAMAGRGLVLDNDPAMKLVVDDRPVELDPGA